MNATPCTFYRVHGVTEREWEAFRNHWIWYDRWESECTILALHQEENIEWIEMTELESTGFPYNIWVAYHHGILTIHEDLFEWLVAPDEDHFEFEDAPQIVADLLTKIRS